MSQSKPTPPEPLQGNSVEARVIKQKVWDKCHLHNLHFIAAVVGREGSGKSYTGLKLAEVADPGFNVDQIMFDPADFLERLREWRENGETKGKVCVADEAGVGLGTRTWYDKDQILFNQVLQVIRDENMGIIFTLPRLSELDSQARGRLHAFIEMTDKEDGEWGEFKWLNWDPTRDERDKTYRNYPEMRINGSVRAVKRMRVGPPSDELVERYQERKNEFQMNLYEEALAEMDDADDADDMTCKEVATEMTMNGLDGYVSTHNQTGNPYINKNLIRAEYELSHADSETVKSLLEQQFKKDDLEQFV